MNVLKPAALKSLHYHGDVEGGRGAGVWRLLASLDEIEVETKVAAGDSAVWCRCRYLIIFLNCSNNVEDKPLPVTETVFTAHVDFIKAANKV